MRKLQIWPFSDKSLPDGGTNCRLSLRSRRSCQSRFRRHSSLVVLEPFAKRAAVHNPSLACYSHNSEQTHLGLGTSRRAAIFVLSSRGGPNMSLPPTSGHADSRYLAVKNPTSLLRPRDINRQTVSSVTGAALSLPLFSVRAEPWQRAWLSETLYFLMTREQRLSQCDLTRLA